MNVVTNVADRPTFTLVSRKPFENMMRDHYRKAYSFAYRMAGNREDAEDITQEAFVRAYRAYDRYDPERPFEKWIFRIISNLFIDSLRGRPKKNTLSLDSPMEGNDGEEIYNEISDPNSDPANIVLREVVDEKIQGALNSLPSQFRETVILTDIEGLSYEETADLLGCAVGTIRSRLHRARVMMRSFMDGKPVGIRKPRTLSTRFCNPAAA